jgi:hypothetical protein
MPPARTAAVGDPPGRGQMRSTAPPAPAAAPRSWRPHRNHDFHCGSQANPLARPGHEPFRSMPVAEWPACSGDSTAGTATGRGDSGRPGHRRPGGRGGRHPTLETLVAVVGGPLAGVPVLSSGYLNRPGRRPQPTPRTAGSVEFVSHQLSVHKRPRWMHCSTSCTATRSGSSRGSSWWRARRGGAPATA